MALLTEKYCKKSVIRAMHTLNHLPFVLIQTKQRFFLLQNIT